MEKRPVVLMILDGYGLNDNCEANAVCEGKTPIMDQLMSQCPFVKELMKVTLDGARHRLMDMLCNYQGYRKYNLIVVFDAYKVKGNPGSVEHYGDLSVVYTREAQTADSYIERLSYDLGKKHRVRVATSDGLEQIIILGHGALRTPASVFLQEVEDVMENIRSFLTE